MDMKKRTGFVAQFVCIMHQMLCGSESYVSNKDILLSFAKQNKFADESIESLMVDYGLPLKKAKCEVRKCLKQLGLDFDEIRVDSDRRKVLFRYPHNTPFELLYFYVE